MLLWLVCFIWQLFTLSSAALTVSQHFGSGVKQLLHYAVRRLWSFNKDDPVPSLALGHKDVHHCLASSCRADALSVAVRMLLWRAWLVNYVFLMNQSQRVVPNTLDRVILSVRWLEGSIWKKGEVKKDTLQCLQQLIKIRQGFTCWESFPAQYSPISLY